ncbi:stage II sporulation protein E [Blautia hydrogenotrophica]|uniref:SpoIIE family protein phosphatase n=1 Tax=Blautia hydrogenotrophica TaxID=53443 RepID=UPI0006C61874|nr:SpoIIE family protein phosphatase [Blautia hydrogenotrophica]CUM68684.1 stage II sporulation protein E [Blautia hydrogenotrophica]SCI20187.1 stage II sporulation protein E [uncultured Blautia sp.]
MSFGTDIAWKSLNKHGEELCGDMVKIVRTKDSDIVILADGMGSGVKANILATLTSQILATMLLKGASIASCVETIAKTLPICQERNVAYATFSILQIYRDGQAYLVEYDNPSCVFIRDRKIVAYEAEEQIIDGKKIKEYRFQAKENDCFVLMSDGVIFAGAGELLNYGWTWESMAEYTLRCTRNTMSASRLVSMLSGACNDLYEQRPRDDTTVVVVRTRKAQIVNLLTGPPADEKDDERMVRDLMESEGKKIISGGSSANLTARILRKEIVTHVNYADPFIPPTASIEGIDLVTEGALTLAGTLKLLQKFEQSEFDEEFFRELDQDNGASKLAKTLIEECTQLHLLVGTVANQAYQNSELSFDISVRKNLVTQIKETMEKMGKTVTVQYY